MHAIKIVVCGPSRLTRRSVASRVTAALPDAYVVGEAPSVAVAAAVVRRTSPDVVIVAGDAGHPGRSVELLRRASSVRPKVILMPAEPLPPLPEAAAVLPRSRYSTRAVVAVLTRVLCRV